MIDFHCHLDLYPNPANIVEGCKERGVFVLSVTTTPSAWHGTLALAGKNNHIRTAIGLHPQLVHERSGELSLFEELLPLTNYVGEVGLDGSPEYQQHWKTQVEVFNSILMACHREGGRILSIHSRGASESVLEQLEMYDCAGTAVLHWFSGTIRELERAIDLGCWFSVGPAMLCSKKGRALTMRMPQERVLTESDGPFAQLKGRAVWPWEVSEAVNELAKLWTIDEQEMQIKLQSNLRNLIETLP